MEGAGQSQGFYIGTHITFKSSPLCAEMCSGPRSQFLLIQAGNSDFSCSFITILRDFQLIATAAAPEMPPQMQGGSFWCASESHSIFTHFRSKSLLADAWQRRVFGDEKVSWFMQQHGDRCLSAEIWAKNWQGLWPQRARLPFMPNNLISVGKEERECRGKVTTPTFSRTKIAKIAMLPNTVRFGVCEV